MPSRASLARSDSAPMRRARAARTSAGAVSPCERVEVDERVARRRGDGRAVRPRRPETRTPRGRPATSRPRRAGCARPRRRRRRDTARGRRARAPRCAARCRRAPARAPRARASSARGSLRAFGAREMDAADRELHPRVVRRRVGGVGQRAERAVELAVARLGERDRHAPAAAGIQLRERLQLPHLVDGAADARGRGRPVLRARP